jgi:glutamyl-tRNA synthetase
MENYIWDLYKKGERPTFMHYRMLKIETGFKLSKTKAREMIERGEYTGWDDPRIWSLHSLKRRGIRPEAIRDFIVSLGMSLADVAVPVEILYSKNRSIIDKEADRYFFVEKPVKVEVTGAPKKIVAKVPVHPEKKGFRTFAFSDGLRVLVEKNDLAMLKKEKMVRLKDLANIGFSAGKVCYSKDQSTVYEIKKMHWLPEKGNVDVRILMPDGKWIEGIAEPDIKKVKRDDIIQFERFGFCRFDGKDFIFSHK